MASAGGRLDKKVALITAAGSGIGRAIALQFAAEGAHVVVNDLPPKEGQPDTAAETAELCRKASAGWGGKAIHIHTDVSDREAVKAMVEDAAAQMGRIDVRSPDCLHCLMRCRRLGPLTAVCVDVACGAQICVSNASFSQRDNFLDMDWESAQRTFDVTQFGAMHVCQFAAKQMVAQGDMPADRPGTYKIVLISSVMADLPHLIPSSFSYNMAKASLDALTKSMASGMAQHSITVNAVHPGWIDTRGEREFTNSEDMRLMARHLPFGIGQPTDVAKGVTFLASSDADYITGTTLTIDGGFSVAQRIPQLHEPIICAREPIHDVVD